MKYRIIIGWGVAMVVDSIHYQLNTITIIRHCYVTKETLWLLDNTSLQGAGGERAVSETSIRPAWIVLPSKVFSVSTAVAARVNDMIFTAREVEFGTMLASKSDIAPFHVFGKSGRKMYRESVWCLSKVDETSAQRIAYLTRVLTNYSAECSLYSRVKAARFATCCRCLIIYSTPSIYVSDIVSSMSLI